LIPLAVIALVLPHFTKAHSGMLTDIQAVSIGIATILFYFIFLGVQTMRYREFFLDVDHGDVLEKRTFRNPSARDGLPSLVHFAMLFIALLIIVFMGRELAKLMDCGIHRLGVPTAFGGIVIAMLTLTPESVSAFKAALDDRLQHSVNVFLGGALSTNGLTVPCVLITGLLLDRRVVLGLQGTDLILLVLTLLISMLTFGGVRTNAL
jgi:Ca2+:H+ antiporter